MTTGRINQVTTVKRTPARNRLSRRPPARWRTGRPRFLSLEIPSRQNACKPSGLAMPSPVAESGRAHAATGRRGRRRGRRQRTDENYTPHRERCNLARRQFDPRHENTHPAVDATRPTGTLIRLCSAATAGRAVRDPDQNWEGSPAAPQLDKRRSTARYQSRQARSFRCDCCPS